MPPQGLLEHSTPAPEFLAVKPWIENQTAVPRLAEDANGGLNHHTQRREA